MACKIWTLPQDYKKYFRLKLVAIFCYLVAAGDWTVHAGSLCFFSIKPSRSLAFAKRGCWRRSGCILYSPWICPSCLFPGEYRFSPADCCSSEQALGLLPTLCLILALRFGSPVRKGNFRLYCLLCFYATFLRFVIWSSKREKVKLGKEWQLFSTVV